MSNQIAISIMPEHDSVNSHPPSVVFEVTVVGNVSMGLRDPFRVIHFNVADFKVLAELVKSL